MVYSFSVMLFCFSGVILTLQLLPVKHYFHTITEIIAFNIFAAIAITNNNFTLIYHYPTNFNVATKLRA